MARKKTLLPMYGVVRRVVPAHGYKIGCTTEAVASGMFATDAHKLAAKLQLDNPDEEYAVTELVFRHWTKPQE